MLVFPSQTLAGVGNSGIIRPYQTIGPLGGILVGQLTDTPADSMAIYCTVSPGASLTYTVLLTGDVAPSLGGNWIPHDVLIGLISSKASNVLYGVSGIMLNVSVWANGSVSLGVVQWP